MRGRVGWFGCCAGQRCRLRRARAPPRSPPPSARARRRRRRKAPPDRPRRRSRGSAAADVRRGTALGALARAPARAAPARQPRRRRATSPGTTSSPTSPIEKEGTFWMPKAVNDGRRRLRHDVLSRSSRCRSFFFFAIAVAVVYFVIKYRHRPGTRPSRRRRTTTRSEITWTVIPTIIAVFLFCTAGAVHPRRHAAEQGRRDQRARVALELAVHARERRHRLGPPRPGRTRRCAW